MLYVPVTRSQLIDEKGYQREVPDVRVWELARAWALSLALWQLNWLNQKHGCWCGRGGSTA